MSVELRTHAAVDRATAERERVEKKRAAFQRFAARVESVSTTNVGAQNVQTKNAGRAAIASAASTNTAGSVLAAGTPSASPGLSAVKTAFRETVLPSTDADSVDDALADELSPDLATALSASTGGLTAESKRRLLERVDERRAECRLLADAIDAERERLTDTADELDDITAWLAAADETPLSQLAFEDLRERHERLQAHRETCDELAAERQTALRGTRNDGLTGIRKRDLLALLYDDFAVDHPVLADFARVDDLLADCQRTVRRHLCSRA